MILGNLTDWLASETRDSVVLVEFGAFDGQQEVTLKLSSKGYTTKATDAEPHHLYYPWISSVGKVSEALSLDGKAQLAIGEISLDNTDNDLTYLMDWVFDGRDVKVLFGDMSWPYTDFITVFKGSSETLQVKSLTELSVSVTSTLQVLNTTVTSSTYDDNTVKPLCFGEVSNIPAKLVDSATLTYQVHDGRIAEIIEVRDRGVPVEFTSSVETGEFTLTRNPFGTITCSVKGCAESGYQHKVSGVVEKLASQYGDTSAPTVTVDQDNFTHFQSQGDPIVGVFLNAKQNLLDLMFQIAGSAGASVTTSAEGDLRLHRFTKPSLANKVTTVTSANIYQDSLKITTKLPIVAGNKLAFCRNYSPGSDLSPALPLEHRELLQEEWLYVKTIDPTIGEKYGIPIEVDPVPTLLQVEAEAQYECHRWFDIFSEQMYICTFNGYSELLGLELGDEIGIVHNRFNLNAETPGLVVGVTKDWVNETITVEVLI